MTKKHIPPKIPLMRRRLAIPASTQPCHFRVFRGSTHRLSRFAPSKRTSRVLRHTDDITPKNGGCQPAAMSFFVDVQIKGMLLGGLTPHRSPFLTDAWPDTPPSNAPATRDTCVPPPAQKIPARQICQRPGGSPTRQKPTSSDRFPVVAPRDTRYNHSGTTGSMPIRRRLVSGDAFKGASARCPGRFAGRTVNRNCCGVHGHGDHRPYRAPWWLQIPRGMPVVRNQGQQATQQPQASWSPQ